MQYAADFEDIYAMFNNAAIGIHFVNAEGIIIYANQSELDMLGYTPEEYIGHHCGEFQPDTQLLYEMMTRLRRQQTLKNYPAMIKGKHETKYVLFNSNVYFKDNNFVHTRCFATDIYKPVYDVFVSQLQYI
jgi:PAS domain S-box-containing protein